jgi:8-oxo-dGTP diphosphatase
LARGHVSVSTGHGLFLFVEKCARIQAYLTHVMTTTTKRHTLVPNVYAFFIKGDQILLARRFNTGYEDGKYSLPAGHLDGDERSTHGMAREIVEETGVAVDPDNLRMVHMMHRKGPDDERLDLFFMVQQWEGDPVIVEADKCDELAWFSMGALPENVIPYIRSAIEAFRHGQFYSEFGWDS